MSIERTTAADVRETLTRLNEAARWQGIQVGTFVDRGIRRWAVTRDGKPLSYWYSRGDAEAEAVYQRARLADPQAGVLDDVLEQD
jgi:hypothetical protein